MNLYRRHADGCNAGRVPDSLSYEADEKRERRQRGSKQCTCPIYASGTLARRFKRKNTGCTAWDEAKTVAAKWEVAGNWEQPAAGPVLIVPGPVAEQPSVTIQQATDAFIANRRNRGIASATLAKYETFTKQLRAYADGRGYTNLNSLTVLDMDQFYASWKDGKRARAKKLERLKSFVKFCMKRKWMTENIAEDLEAPEGSSTPANKAPFTDGELDRIYRACDALGGPTPPGPGHREWSGADKRLHIPVHLHRPAHFRRSHLRCHPAADRQ